MAANPLTATLVLAAVNVAQQYAQRKNEQDAVDAQARTLEQHGEVARARAAAQEADLRRQTARTLGRQRALYGKAGVTLEGSPLLVQDDAATAGEIDALNVRRAGEAAYENAFADANTLRRNLRAKRRAEMFGAGRTLLTSLFGGPASMQSPGAWSEFPTLS